MDAVADHPTRLRSLAAAVTAHANGVLVDAPPIMGRLVVELIARGARGLSVPTCVAAASWAGTRRGLDRYAAEPARERVHQP